MLKVLIPCLLLFGSCSSLQSNCNGTKNWFEEGRKSHPGNAESYIQALQMTCEDQITTASLADYHKGRAHQAKVSCTGSEKFPTSGWKSLGEEMALRGDEEADYLKLKAKCALHPSNEELKEYKKSFQQSLLSLCTKVGGMEFARRGHSYKSTCPKNKERDFFTGQKIGLKMKEADEINEEIKNLRTKIDELQNENVRSENLTTLCQDKIAGAKSDGKIESRYDECMVTNVSEAQNKISQSKKVIRDNNVKILGLNQELTRKKEALEQKYKEIEIYNNLLKSE